MACLSDHESARRKGDNIVIDGVIEKMQSEIRLLREKITVNKIKMDAYKQYIKTYRNRQKTGEKE